MLDGYTLLRQDRKSNRGGVAMYVHNLISDTRLYSRIDFIPDLVDYMHNYSTKIIIDDFNADQLSDSADANFLRNLASENSLTSIPFGATYHTSTSDSTLDLCFVD